ncbi:Heme oxygenase (staphylobilin-producing) 1 [Lysinibacillus sphaericus]|uniref:Heme oxygenase (Staphylobilin-producing) 1 n=1 Tax=Lysinibacillus sphaericus TaxID=1421 RepID=A0A2S5D2Q0_LYSSH|nr:antibiotic biosynthesis monooxygenase [Lysinibacillus sphaericus]POZ57321.1 Heme oxygenase (staphylobilin-producing) 1 [Lysinibacillus sphaericus]
MITVTNRFLLKKGFAHKMAPLFTTDKTLLNWEGFHKVEVNICSEPENHDEMNVMMFWDTIEQFEAWRESDDFIKLHRRERIANKENSESSPIISNRIVISEIAASLVK